MSNLFEHNKNILLKNVSQCELCGNNFRGLEVHHIIPRSLGGSEEKSNLILLCEKCHYKLTPKKELQAAGIKRVKAYRALKLEFYTMCRNADAVAGVDVMDVFDELIQKMEGSDFLRTFTL